MPGGLCALHRFGIADRQDQRVLEVVLKERAQHAGGVARGATPGIVLAVGDHDWARTCSPSFSQRVVERDQINQELLALGEDPIRVSLGLAPGSGRVTVGHHDDGRAGLGNVGPGEPRVDGGGEDAWLGFELMGAGDDAVERLEAGHIAAGPEQRQALDRHAGTNLSAQCANHEVGGFLAAFPEVDVGIGVAGDDHVGQFGHRVADVGVQVERDDDRPVGAQDRAHAAQEVAFAVVDALDDHCAVQVQQRAVDRHGGFQALEELGFQAGPGLGVDRAGGFGEGPEQRNQLVAVGCRAVDEAAAPGVGIAHGFDEFGASVEAAGGLLKRLVGRLDGSEGAGLVPDVAGGNAHNAAPGLEVWGV